jgi:rubrerythrin
MNIFEYAMQMEKDGEAYYRELASKCKQEGLTHILNLMADDEVGHYEAFKKLRDESSAEIADSVVLKSAKNIFSQMKGQLADFNFDASEIDLYKKAVNIEKEAAQFYREKAEEITDPDAKKVVLKIAGDEQKHQFLLENMVDFLARPETWVENAEFNHLDEY